jgi:ATP-dependent helicase HrpB
LTRELPDLPIRAALPQLAQAFERVDSVVLQAPPGAGKSTLVPLALLDADWLARRRILMLEPRRVATRAIAMRMAALLDETVGRTVGYRTRLDTRVGAATRIEVVTEGILTRMLASDPALDGVGLVIFDEFHERNLDADLALTLCLDARTQLESRLKLLVMSATLETAAVARVLGNAEVVQAEGRAHPVEIEYLPRTDARLRTPGEIARATTVAVLKALGSSTGDVLVFLPGLGEIRRVADALGAAPDTRDCAIRALHGNLAAAEQDAALLPDPAGQRRIVLATNIAETSLTIEGIRVVVDSGLERRARFDPATAMSRLVTANVSQASATQRCGRAGRVAPGTCYRIWSEDEQARLAPTTPPEILEADLANLALELANWGTPDADALRWLDAPPRAPLDQAFDLLAAFGAVGPDRRITQHGRSLLRLGAHPRLAQLLRVAQDRDCVRLGALVAAVLGERDPLRDRSDVDLRSRLGPLLGQADAGVDFDRDARQRLLRAASQYEQRLGGPRAHGAIDIDATGGLLAAAYPDRIAQSRGRDGRYLLANGRGAVIAEPQSITQHEYLVIADLEGGGRDARIRLAAPITLDEIESLRADAIETTERIEWEPRERVVDASRERRLGAIVLERRTLPDPDPDRMTAALITGLRAAGLEALPWTREARALVARIEFLRAAAPQAAEEFPASDAASLLAALEQWLAPWLAGIRRLADLARLDLRSILASRLSWDQQRSLDELAPTHLVVPSGSRIPIAYDGAAPTLAARLQELFGMSDTPRIAGGRVPLTIELLSPARRPVQITRDLASFWAEGYHEVRRELKGRYPRHHWPDDPLVAVATARAKPRR